MSDFKVIMTSVIPQVTTVRFYDETVEKVKKGHKEVPIEFPSMMEAVALTITSPTHVEKSYGNSYVYVHSGTTNKSGDPMRVPVRIVEGTSARVTTVILATKEVDDEDIVYRRDEDE